MFWTQSNPRDRSACSACSLVPTEPRDCLYLTLLLTSQLIFYSSNFTRNFGAILRLISALFNAILAHLILDPLPEECQPISPVTVSIVWQVPSAVPSYDTWYQIHRLTSALSSGIQSIVWYKCHLQCYPMIPGTGSKCPLQCHPMIPGIGSTV